MAYLELECLDGTIEVVLFPEVFSKTLNIAQLDEVVVIEGRIENSSGKIQLVAQAVIAIEDYLPDFWLTVPAQIDKPATLDKLSKLFAEHSGSNHVCLNRKGSWKRIELKISDNPVLRGELINLLGADNIRLY